MSISRRFALIFGGLILGLLATLLVLRWLELRAHRQELNLFLEEQRTFLKHWLAADNQTLLTETQGLAHELASRPSGDFSHDLKAASPFVIWELSENGEVTVLRSGELHPVSVKLLSSTPFLKNALRHEGGWFYFSARGSFYQAAYAPIPSAPRWLLVIREWDFGLLRQLSSLTGGSIALRNPNQSPPPALEGYYRLTHQLNDWRGQPLKEIELCGSLPQTSHAWAQSKHPVVVFLVFGVLVITALILCLQRWVTTPLKHIRQSLTNETILPVRPYLNRPDEMGTIARLIENTEAQREALQKSESQLRHALDERTRLGRDLHDGVIQSLYATGMTLATTQARLPSEDQVNRDSLDQARSTLNEVILDLRNFITGLEPEALKQATFTDAINGIMKVPQTEQNLKITNRIDEDLAHTLNISQRAHLLQITREALSNALRHGAATEITVELSEHDSQVEYHFHDNGSGFDPDAAHSRCGHGLENLAERARDMGAVFSVQSYPGQGTRLKLAFKLPS